MRQLILIVALILFAPTIAQSDELKFEWDYDDNVGQEGFNLYSGPMGQNEDGTWAPKLGSEPIAANIPPDSRTVTATERGWADVAKKWCFVLRAYRGDKESSDSNTVCVTIDNTAIPAPTQTAGSFSMDTETITLSWTQEQVARVKYWKVYYKMDNSEFVEFGQLENTGNMALSLTAPFDQVQPGEDKNVLFAIVAFKDYELYSQNSEEISIQIDRSDQQGELPEPTNLRFTVEIPVL